MIWLWVAFLVAVAVNVAVVVRQSGESVPDWFRRGVRWLRAPQQCVMCGTPLIDSVRRRPFEGFCSQRCVDEWDEFADQRL